MSPALALRTNLVAVDIGLISDLLCYSLQSAISTTTFYTNLIKAPYNLIKAPYNLIEVPLSHQGSTRPSRFHYNLIKVPLSHQGSTRPSRFHTTHQGSISTIKVPYQPSRFISTIKVHISTIKVHISTIKVHISTIKVNINHQGSISTIKVTFNHQGYKLPTIVLYKPHKSQPRILNLTTLNSQTSKTRQGF